MSAGPLLIDQLITWFWPWGRHKLDTLPHRRQIFLWFIVLGVFWAGFSAWRDEHQARLATAKLPLDPSMIYQDGFPVAYFGAIETDAKNNTLSFNIVTSSRELDMSKPFEFREWKLLCSGKEDGMSFFGAMRQIHYNDFICKIQGQR